MVESTGDGNCGKATLKNNSVFFSVALGMMVRQNQLVGVPGRCFWPSRRIGPQHPLLVVKGD